MPADAPIAFFSYSREDSEFALRLATDLKAAGSAVWIDQLDIGPGQLWDRTVQSALENCPCMLLILSPASVNSDNVMDEVSFALDQKKTLIPVLYRDCDIPFRIRRFQHLDFRTEYERMLQELKKCLHLTPKPQEAASASAQHEEAAHPVAPPPLTPIRPFETGGAGSEAAASRPTAHAAPPQQFPPQYAPPAQSGPPAYGAPKSASSKFPKWAKITLGVFAGLLLLGVLMNMGSNSGTPARNDSQGTRDEAANSPGAADRPRDYAANPPAAADRSSEPGDNQGAAGPAAQLVRSALARHEAPPACRFPEQSATDFSVNDPAVWYVFSYRGGAADDEWTITWFRPNNGHNFVNFRTETVSNPVAGLGTYCYFIRVAGFPPHNMPGDWLVRLERNGVQMDQIEFRINPY